MNQDFTWIYREGVATCCKVCGISTFSHKHKAGTEPKDFERLPDASKTMETKSKKDYSHSHCWNQKGENKPACGQPLETHTQCCLCEEKYHIGESNNMVPLPTEDSWEGDIEKWCHRLARFSCIGFKRIKIGEEVKYFDDYIKNSLEVKNIKQIVKKSFEEGLDIKNKIWQKREEAQQDSRTSTITEIREAILSKIQKFITKVETGQARSKETYSDMVAIKYYLDTLE